MAFPLKEVMDAACEHLTIDKEFAGRITDFANGFINKNQNHIKFFGSGLIGVHELRWTPADTDKLFDVVMDGLDDVDLQKKLYSIPGIDPNWRRATDTINNLLVYLVHRFEVSNLPAAVKVDAQLQLLIIMNCRFLSSLMAHYFRHGANEQLAMATYSQLTKKFDLKVAGSWLAWIQQRAADTLGDKGIHNGVFKKYNDVKAIVYCISDNQQRVRNMVKKVTEKFYEIKDAGRADVKTSMFGMDSEGGEYIRDTITSQKKYETYLASIINDRAGFLRSEVLRAILAKQTTASDNKVVNTIRLLSERYGNPKYPDVERLCTEALIHAFEMMYVKRIRTNDFNSLVDALKKSYMASRETNPSVLEMRRIADNLVREANGMSRSAVAAPERGALLLYIVIRTLAKDHFN